MAILERKILLGNNYERSVVMDTCTFQKLYGMKPIQAIRYGLYYQYNGYPYAISKIDGDQIVLRSVIMSIAKIESDSEQSTSTSIATSLRPCSAIIYQDGGTVEVSGWFHTWGSYYDEFETGPGNCTSAIIELEDGRVVWCPPENVRFTDRG